MSWGFNSATAHRPWRLRKPEEFALNEYWLQFGHGTSAVETLIRDYEKDLAKWLQFGHGTSAVETCDRRRARDGLQVGFNSATAHRPWRPSATTKTRKTPARLQFGHGTSAVETCCLRGFKVQTPPASIRPRHIGRGDPALCKSSRRPTGRFNSATAHRPWRPTIYVNQPSVLLRLQFGHGTSAVETSNVALAPKLLTRLQFGHGTSAVETPHGHIRLFRATELQFGHGTSAVETRPSSGIGGRSWRFNSATAHRPWRRGKLYRPETWEEWWLQFGHGTSAVETPAYRASGIPRSNRLQFGHGTSAVET